MKKYPVIISLVTFLIITACSLSSGLGFQTINGSGKVIDEAQEVSGFNQVDVCCGMELYFTQGDSEALRIQADDNFMEEIETRVVNGKLEIAYQEDTNVFFRPSQPVRLYLSAVELHAVSVSGGGLFETKSLTSSKFRLDLSGGSDAVVGDFEVDDLHINISGGGNIIAAAIQTDAVGIELSGSSDAEIEALTAKTLTLESSGGGDTSVAGSVKEAKIDLSGSSGFDGNDLKIQYLTISCSGGGNATVWVEDSLDADLSGGSTLGYYGHPDISHQDLSGGSNLESLGSR